MAQSAEISQAASDLAIKSPELQVERNVVLDRVLGKLDPPLKEEPSEDHTR